MTLFSKIVNSEPKLNIVNLATQSCDKRNNYTTREIDQGRSGWDEVMYLM